MAEEQEGREHPSKGPSQDPREHPEIGTPIRGVRRQTPALVNHDRMTVTFQAHHETYEEQPHSTVIQYWEELEGQEQPYERKLKIGEEWVQLDFNWMKTKAGLLLLHNRSGQILRPNIPTPEEKAAAAKQILRIKDTHIMVRPGRFFFGEFDNEDVYVKSDSGVLPLLMVVYPR